MSKTNPNGANQYIFDPRQKLCWDIYINPKSKTFGNAYQSAVEVGYTESSAARITTEAWFAEKLRRLNMLGKAEKVLDEMLEMPVDIQKVEGYGEDKELVIKTEPALVKIKQDTAKFIADRLGKDEGYSQRTELTAKGGDRLITESTVEIDKLTNILNEIHKRNGESSDGEPTLIMDDKISDKE
jgi:endo-1,4-beta-mannosidase